MPRDKAEDISRTSGLNKLEIPKKNTNQKKNADRSFLFSIIFVVFHTQH